MLAYYNNNLLLPFLATCTLCLLIGSVASFAPTPSCSFHTNNKNIALITWPLPSSLSSLSSSLSSPLSSPRPSRSVNNNSFLLKLKATESDNNDPAQVVGKRIIVRGDVNGGYVRTCIRNEASRFRKLIGTMSPPEDSDKAEIYVEGKRRNVDGFIRWCSKGSKKIGLSQALEVIEVTDEVPTGLYDDFYVKTGTE